MPDTMAVPSTPEWNLLELIAHLTGSATDLVSGNADDWAVIHEHRRANLDEAVTEAALTPLRVRTIEGDDWTVGGDLPGNEVVLPRHELWRSLTGRRTRREVANYQWSCDPTPYLQVWVSGTFSWPPGS